MAIPGGTRSGRSAGAASTRKRGGLYGRLTAGGGEEGGSPSGPVIKTHDSTNSTPIGASDETDGTVTRGGLGDIFDVEDNDARATWTHTAFSNMNRREIFDVEMRFDSRPTEANDWEQMLMLRPFGGAFVNQNCVGSGNATKMLLRIYSATSSSPDGWRLDIRGGETPNLADQVIDTVNLGNIVEDETIKLSFDIITKYTGGACSVWKNDVLVYEDRDRPLGFHYDCNGTTDLSNHALRMQHGIYRGSSGIWSLTSTGFRFYTSEAA